jgi:hypothetical protein
MSGIDLDRVEGGRLDSPYPVGPIEQALNMIVRCSGCEGEHHKDWVLDQVTRILAGDQYEELVRRACGEEYEWEVGIAP